MTFDEPIAVSVSPAGWWVAEHERLVHVDPRGAVLREVPLARAYVCGFSRDGRWALAVAMRGSELVELATGKVGKIAIKLNARCASLSDDGRMAAIATENEIAVWDLAAKACVWKRAACDHVSAITADGTRVAYGANPPPGIAVAAAIPKARATKLGKAALTGLCWLPDGTLVSAHGAAGVQRWDAGKPRVLARLAAVGLVASPDGTRVAFRAGEIVHVLDVATGATRAVGRGRCYAFAANGIVLVDRTAELHAAQGGSLP